MNQEINSYLKKIQSKQDIKKYLLNRKFLVFLFFVAIATVFWLLNALSKEYTATIDHPIRYYNFPKEKVLVGKLPTSIEIKINAFGFSILKYKYKLRTSFDAIDLDVKQLGLRKVSGTKSRYYILTRYERERISKQLKKEIKLLEVYPDTIYFDLADIVYNKVPVIPIVKFELDKQTMLNGDITVEPDSIQVSGPQTIIDTVSAVRTDFQDLKILSNTITRNIGIQSIEGVKYDTKRVIVKVPAEKFTEHTFSKQLKIINLPDSLVIKTFPSKIDISYQVALSNFEKVIAEDFILIADFNDTKSSISNKIKVELDTASIYAKKIKYYPIHVEYIIEKK